MRSPLRFVKKLSRGTLLILLLVGAFVVYAATVDRTVYTTEQLIIIPDTVTSDSWLGLESVLVQDISEYSLYQDFSESNAAYISELALFSQEQVDGDSNAGPDAGPNDEGNSVDTEPISEPEATNTDSSSSDTEEAQFPSENQSAEQEVIVPESEEVVEDVAPEPAPVTEEPAAVEPAPETVSQARSSSNIHWGVFPVSEGLYPLAQGIDDAPTPDVSEVEVKEEAPEAPAPEEDVVVEESQEAEVVEEVEIVDEDMSSEESQEESIESSVEEVTTQEGDVDVQDSIEEESEPIQETPQEPAFVLEPCEEAVGCQTHSLYFSGFTLPEFESGTILDSVQLRLSLAAMKKTSLDDLQRFVVEYTYDTATTGKTWTISSVIDIEDEISNSINGGYYLMTIATPQQADQIANLQIRVSYQGDVRNLERAYVESIWLEVEAGSFYEEGAGEPYTDSLTYGRDLLAPSLNTLNNPDLDPALSSLPTFTLSYDPQAGFLNRVFTGLFSENTFAVEKISLRNAAGEEVSVPFKIVYHDDLTWTMQAQAMPQKLQPGKYTVSASFIENGEVYTDSFEFYWGLLAVNTKKSMYFPNESVELNLAALTDKGDTICDARLELKIIDPKNNIYEVPVEQSGACGENNVTDIPDYIARFAATGEWGVYTIQLRHLNVDGQTVHRITDSFEVRDYIPFDIERTAPTRIYPPAPYDVSLKIKAYRDFVGDITERVPRGFAITNIEGAEISTLPEYTLITWKDITMSQGEERVLSYQFDAPDISPYMYLLGPLDMDGFSELRQWQIASDALTSIAVLTGTRTVGGTNLNDVASPFQWATSSVDAFYFSHSTSTNSHQVTLRQAGDYVVSVTLPHQRTDANNSRTRVSVRVQVNGVDVPQGLGRSSYIRNQNGNNESSAHANFFLDDVTADDVLEVLVEGMADIDVADIVNITGQAGLYVEYIPNTKLVFAATTSSTTNSTNFNQTTAYPLVWNEVRQDTGFVHSNTVNPQNIVLSDPGAYLVQLTLPVTSATANQGVLGRVLLNGVQVSGGVFAQGYTSGTEGDIDASLHWSGVVVSTSSNQILTVTTEREGQAATVVVPTGFVGGIYIEELPATETIVLRGRDLSGGTDWSVTPAQSVLWDTRLVYDASTFTHSTTTNRDQITIGSDGDYLLTFNDALNVGTANANTRITVTVNGVAVSGAQTKTNYTSNANGHTNGSAAMTFVLPGLTTGQIVRVLAEQEGNTATTNDTTDAILMLTKKAELNLRATTPSMFDTPFDNIRFASTTPHFDFQSSDPDGISNIEYEFSIGTSSDFADAVTFSSDADPGFSNTASSTDTAPFIENNRIRFQLQSGDALTDLTTYYWRVRAKDVTGANEFGDWSTTQSLTVDLADTVPSWYQNETGQFESNTLIGAVSSGNNNNIQVDATDSTEILVGYGDSTNTTPRYRLWNGTSWGTELNAIAVSGTINWVRTAAGITRDEYMMVTIDSANDVFAQVYSASSSSFANRVLLTDQIANAAYRGAAVGYESLSGDAMVVSCDNNSSPTYRIWNGSTWSATSSLTVSSGNNCAFIEIASDPASDEMIVVVRDATTQYEALVWDGSSWVDNRVIGAVQAGQEARSGIGVRYETSGNQALVVVTNGANSNVVYTTWNGTEWSANATQAIGDDFEYGALVTDPLSDKLALCYIDEDSDIGVLRWDGGVWSTFIELDISGNSPAGRPVDCKFETSAGRTGNILVTYSDTVAARYQVYNGTSWSGEQTITGIGTAGLFWAQAERAGDGTIVSMWHDDAATGDEIESSYWNGTAWSVKQSIVPNPSSVLGSPYETFEMAAKKFQFTEGVVITPPINFTAVPNQPTWGDISFTTSEPFGTNVLLRVRYTATTTCDSYVPNGILPGNAAGFDVSAVPVVLTPLSTSTYSQLCLEATMTTLGSESASLENWTLSWLRKPKLIQNRYRWYGNGSYLTPTDPWPLGVTDLAENTNLGAGESVNVNQVIRLRLALEGANVDMPIDTEVFKLQYATGFDCSVATDWTDVGEVGSTTALWRGYENAIVGDDWYDAAWERRISVTIDSSLVPGNQTDFPVFVNLADLPDGFFSSVQSDGDDIRITEADGVTELPYELVSIDTVAKTGELHFKADVSSTTDSEFYVYYGNSGASGYGVSATYGRNNVWTNGFLAVYHLDQNPAGGAPQYIDSTGNTSGTANNMEIGDRQTSLIGRAADLDGTNEYIDTNFNQSILASTWSVWLNADGAQGAYDGLLMSRGTLTHGLNINSAGNRLGYHWRDAANTYNWNGAPIYPTNQWFMASLVVEPTQATMYSHAAGGVTSAVNAVTHALATVDNLDIGQDNFAGRQYNGLVDEVTLANVARSSTWLTTTYNNKSNATGFYDVSSEELIGDGRTLPSALLTNSDVLETYEEENPTRPNRNVLLVGDAAEWDFVLQNNAALANTNYCFRMVYEDGATLNAYTQYPRLITNAPPPVPTLMAPFDNEQLASTTPWFEFTTNDEASDDVSYEIMIDDDYEFASPLITRESNANFSLFTNLSSPSERGIYTTGQTIQFIPNTTLTNGVTYYWRVRARDDNGSGTYSEWSVPSSVTINTATAITTWFQTTGEQFATDNLLDARVSTTTDDVGIESGFSVATTTSTIIDYDDRDTGNAWGALQFSHNVTSGSIRYYVEYLVSGDTFELVPDAVLTGNSSGFTSSPVSLVNLDTTTHNEIRVVAVLTGNVTLPRLLNWSVTWSETIEIPTIFTPFDNAKVATTTPSFTFQTTDPESNPLEYEFQYSTSADFTSSTTVRSGSNPGFSNASTTLDTSPFNSGDTVRYVMQSTLTNGMTYWWRTRARDPGGSNTWSDYSAPRSFTVDTAISVSAWHQTTGQQFSTGALQDIETVSGGAQITSLVNGVMAAYGEGTGQAPQYRLWNGTSWSAPASAESVGAQIRWTQLRAAPTRPEYALATLGTDNDINIQIYDAITESWDDMYEIYTESINATPKRFDIGYETNSGDLLAVSCAGNDAIYSIWNGTTWSATSSIALSNASSCEWIEMASDPVSDEITAVFRHTNTNANDYEALIWNGSGWGNAVAFGGMVENAHAGMAVAYEESGNQVVVVVSTTTSVTTGSLMYNTWNGSSWSGVASTDLGDHIEWASLKPDEGSDSLVLCYVDNDNNLGVKIWNGSSWGIQTEIEAAGNDKRGQAIDCEFETTPGRDGDIVIPYSDGTQARYQTYDSGTLTYSGELSLLAMNDGWRMQSVRAADGTVHVVNFDDASAPDRYDSSRWDGSSWSAVENFSTNPSITAFPYDGSVTLAAQIYPNFTSGSIRATPVNFSDGAGPRWESVTWSDTTPGASSIAYRLYYESAPGVFTLIPDSALSGNAAGFTTSPLNIAGLDRTIYSVLALDAEFICVSGNCPTLQDWTIAWSEGITVSGAAYEYNASTTVTTGTVAVAVNGVLQAGKTAAIAGDGTWSITNVTAFPGDVVMAFIDGAADADEAIAISTYDGIGDVTNMELSKRHVTIGSSDSATTTNALLVGYDVADDEDIFMSVGALGEMVVCATTGCADSVLKIKSGAVYQPGATVSTHDFLSYGQFMPDANTVRVNGSWNNLGSFTAGGSTVIFTATTSTETVSATSSSLGFHNVTFGEVSGSASWTLQKPLDISGSLAVDYGTLARGTSSIALEQNLRIGTGGYMSGIGTTTFDGTASFTWTDTSASSTNIGNVVIDGTAKTITLGGNVSAESILIGSDDTLSASGSGFSMNVYRNWTNNHVFIPQTGTVNFVGTSTGVIARGTSAFNNLTFSGVGGSWSFSTSTLAVNGNFTIATGTVTLPTGTTTIAGSFLNTGGNFAHNNGEVRMTSSASGRTIAQRGTTFLNAFYDLVFTGSGAWTFSEGAATTSRNLRITSGTVTSATSTLTVGGNFTVSGSGVFAHNNAELILLVQSANEVRTNGSSLNNVRIKSASGASWLNSARSGRVPLVIREAQVQENVTDFPVYVNLANLPDAFFAGLQSDGDDIRVTQSDGVTEVPYELVTIDTVAKTGELHFKGNLSSAVDTTFYIYYGNASAAGYAVTAPYGRNNVWSNNFAAVYHMEQSPTAAAPQFVDSTGSTTGTANNMEAGDRQAGQIGQATDLDGTNEFVTTTFNRTIQASTWSVWTRIDGAQSAYDGLLFSRSGQTTGLGFSSDGTRLGYHWNDAVATYSWLGAPVYPTNEWFMASLVVTPTQATVYAHASSGVSSGVNTTTHANSLINNLQFGQDSSGGRLFNGMVDEIRIATVARSAGWLGTEYANQASTTAFYATGGVETAFVRTFADTNATILGNFVSELGGDSVFPSGVLLVGGSFDNNATFNSNNGTVRFNSGAGSETIAAGSSTFATVDFNAAGGNFTVTEHATATVAFNLTSAAQFTLGSGVSFTTLGTFTNAAAGANTTWTGSILRLLSGTDITLNNKLHGGDTYGTIEAASSTLARMWNSSAASYVTGGATGAIYSQDHAAVDGDLYIYGNYIRTTGTEHWSYATDFDGTALAGTERQVDVRVASSSQVSMQTATLSVLGIASATTTVNAITNAFSLATASSTLHSNYASFAGTGIAGVTLGASTTLGTLTNTSFSVAGGQTGISIDASTVDTNPAGQFFNVRFATSTAGVGTNVTLSGTPASYIWFRNGTGNLYGEAFDAADGNPGAIRFDDSSFSITISGTVYSDDGLTPMGASICDNVTPVVTIAIDGVAAYTGSCSSSNGTYSIPNVSYIGDADITVYLDSNRSGTTTVALRSETSGTGTSNGSGQFTVNKPASVVNGDYLVVITGKDDDDAVTGPVGWTGYTLGATTGNVRHTGIWYKRVTDATSEPSTYTFTGDATEVFSYWSGSLAGVSPTNPEDVSFAGRWQQVQNDTTPDAASLTTATTNSYVLSAWYVDNDNAVTMPGAPWSTRVANIVSGENNNLSVSSRTVAAPGATGLATITGVGGTADTSMAQFAFRRDVATSSSIRAVAVTKTPTGNITNLDLYQSRVIVRHEDAGPITISDMVPFDSSNDTDTLFTAATGTPNTLVLDANTELYVFGGKTFTPGGNITLRGNANTNGYEGTLQLGSGAAFVAAGTETHTLAGRLVMATTSIMNAASSTFVFNATTTGKSITSPSTITLNNVTFAGVGGAWNITAPLLVTGDMLVASGTVTGTSNITLSNGSLYGNGVLSLGSGTTTLERSNTFGGSTAWTLNNLVFGNGTVVGTTTPNTAATTTILGRLTIANAHYLDAGSSRFDLAGTGTVFLENGTFLEDTSTVRYSGVNANITGTTYYNLLLSAGAGSSTYTGIGSGLTTLNQLTVGGSASTTANFTANDPVVIIGGTTLVTSGATLSLSNSATTTMQGDYDNNGTVLANGGVVRFMGTGSHTIAAGASALGTVVIDGAGSYTITENATTSAAFSLINHAAFTVNPGVAVAVQGLFTNTLGGAATTWASSTLSLLGSAPQTINTKATSDSYGNLYIGAGAFVRMWNSDAATYTTVGGLYSQDHAGTNGLAHIYGAFTATGFDDHWSYTTDFDGTDLSGGSERAVTVAFASGANAVWAGDSLSVLGTSSASTTLQNQGSGTYSLTLGGTVETNWQHVVVRNTAASGLIFSGAPIVTNFSFTDHLVSANGASALTVGGSVINANEAKNFTNTMFAYSGGVVGAVNVTATGTALSSWRFTNHTGNLAGEAQDTDPAGDPGYIVWDDSAALVTVAGNVYSDEGSTVSGVCDGVTNNIVLRVAGLTTYTGSCNATTGAYSISGVAFSPQDTLTLFIDGETEKAATVSKAPVSSISNMHLYENRVIVRHENIDPITIVDMSVWDSSDDADIPFTAIDAGTDTLTLPANRKLLVWTGKTFRPNGNVTLAGGGAGAAHDGSFEALANARFTAEGTQSHSIGGSFVFGNGAIFTAASSTVTFTTTGSARTIDVNDAPFTNVSFTGSGSWTITDPTFTSAGAITQSNGVVTYGSGTTTVGSAFNVSGGSFVMTTGPLLFTASTAGNTVRFNNSSVPTLRFTGGGSWVMTDTNATTTGSVLITGGTVSLPSGLFTVAGSFENTGGAITHNTSEIILTSATAASLRANGSDLFAVTKSGAGVVTMTDTNITLRDSLTVATGTLVAATGTLSIAGSLDVSGGVFAVASNTVLFNAVTTGKTVSLGQNALYNAVFGSGTGGWTWVGNATTTNNLSLTSAASFTKQAGTTLAIGGVFTNLVGGSATTWTNTNLSLTGALAYTINTKAAGGDVYGTMTIGTGAALRAWNSSAATTTLAAAASLYSQDHAATDGLLHVYGNLTLATSTEHWSYNTDFDGTALSGPAARRVNVRFATNATTTLESGTLNIVGTAATTTLIESLAGTYAITVAGGTLNADYYAFSDMNQAGLQFIGTPTITNLSHGYFDMAVSTSSLITIASTSLNANASKVFTQVGFNATNPLTGFNVTLVGETTNAWRFTDSYGNIGSEAFDIDGIDACGSIRFDDSACLLTEQTNVRWRNDDGAEGVPDALWFNSSWDYRQSVRIENDDAVSYATTAVKVLIPYDSSMKADFSDLRFTAGDGLTQIPFWIEKYTASTDAVVWVQVPLLSAQSVTTVYAYFGNAAASSSSNGSATFAAFDSFDDNNISEYSGDTSLFTTDTAPVYGGAYALEAFNKSGRTTDGIFRTDVTTQQGQIIRYMQYINTSAGSGDEACTLFGVQTPGTGNNNYAICLEQFGTDRIVISKNVVDNDVSGTVLSSKNVTYTTGWYEVEAVWETDDSIDVYLYTSAGTLVATTSVTDSSYTSGGIGFTFWFQNGSWDSYTARPLGPIRPAVYLGARQSDGGATWASAQNTPGTAIPGQTRRLRVAIENSGLAITGQTFALEYAAKDGAPSCEAVASVDFAPVPNQSSCGTSPVCMQTSTHITDGGLTSDLLANTSGQFTPGRTVESPSSVAASFDVDQNHYTELEYAITPTLNAVDAYCFRVTNAGTPLDYYETVAELSLQFDPVFGPITLNGGNDILLTPGATTTVYATGTVTDFNGYTDIVAGTSTIYRSGAGAACTANTNNCYVSNTSNQCSFTNCSGNTCELTCRADIYFHADATDELPYEGEEWLAYLEVSDQGNGYDFASAIGVELLTMRALTINNAINYGSLAVGDNTGATNASTSIANLGNIAFDIEVEGTDLTDGATSVIPANQQRFATSTFTYGACVTCASVSSSTPVNFALGLSKPTAPTPPVTAPLYWGIAVPLGVNSAPHQGINVFTPVSIE